MTRFAPFDLAGVDKIWHLLIAKKTKNKKNFLYDGCIPLSLLYKYTSVIF